MGDYLYNYVIGWLSNVTKDINDKNHTLKFLYHRLLHLHFLGLPHIIVKETEQPSPAHTPPRLPRFVVEEAEPVSKRTRSQTRKKQTFIEEETDL